MRVTNGAAAATRRPGKRAIGVVVAGGAVALVLASAGTAMASPFHGHAPSPTIHTVTSWNHVINTPAPHPAGAGNGKTGHRPGSTSTPSSGTPCVSTGHQGGHFGTPTSTSAHGGHFDTTTCTPAQGTPAPSTGDQGGNQPGTTTSTTDPGTGTIPGGAGGQGGNGFGIGGQGSQGGEGGNGAGLGAGSQGGEGGNGTGLGTGS